MLAELIAALESGEATPDRSRPCHPGSTTWPTISTPPASSESLDLCPPGRRAGPPAVRPGSGRSAVRDCQAKRQAETSNAVRYRIAEGYGEALMLLGATRMPAENSKAPSI